MTTRTHIYKYSYVFTDNPKTHEAKPQIPVYINYIQSVLGIMALKNSKIILLSAIIITNVKIFQFNPTVSLECRGD